MEKYDLNLNNEYGDIHQRGPSPSWRFIYNQDIIDKIVEDFYIETNETDRAYGIPSTLISLYNYYCDDYSLDEKYITLTFSSYLQGDKGKNITKPLNDFCSIQLRDNLLFIKYDYSYDLTIFVLDMPETKIGKLKMELTL